MAICWIGDGVMISNGGELRTETISGSSFIVEKVSSFFTSTCYSLMLR